MFCNEFGLFISMCYFCLYIYFFSAVFSIVFISFGVSLSAVT